MNGYRELMRRKLLEEIYDSLSPDDKRLFVQLTIENKDYREIMLALQRQEKQMDEISNKMSWLSDFSSNIAGNAVWDGLVWLGRSLFKRL